MRSDQFGTTTATTVATKATTAAPAWASLALEQFDVRVSESSHAREIYLTAAPRPGASPQQQAERMYGAIAGVLKDAGAAIVGERLIASSDAFQAALRARAESYGTLDDGVRPTLLSDRLVRQDGRGVLGAQVHAVAGLAASPRVLAGTNNVPLARAFEAGPYRYFSASALSSAFAGDAAAEARVALEQADYLLRKAGATFADVARTWLWARDILSWYPQLNEVRTRFFADRGIMSGPGRMPASTGIGVAPAGRHIAMDVFAAWGSDDAVERFDAVGNQRSAYAYGSAFARAARARTPAGTTVFCSGTAAIDARGQTCCIGDIPGQIDMTLENTAAVLRDMECADRDVVQAMAYCASADVAAHFLARHRHALPWPCLVMIGDVCRPDLLFEVEVTACPGSRPA